MNNAVGIVTSRAQDSTKGIFEKIGQQRGESRSRYRISCYGSAPKLCWPGNIRELENVMERAYVLGTAHLLTKDHFPMEIKEASK